MNKNLEENLKNIKVKDLSENDKNEIWSNFVLTKITNEKKQQNKYLLLFNFKKPMIATLLSILILLGGGGVVVASNSAGPGDFLFGLDRTVEKVQLNFSGEGKRNELKIKFADERLIEAKNVIKENKNENPNENSLKFKSEKQSEDIEDSLGSVADALENSDITVEEKARISIALASIMTLIDANPDLKLKIKTEDGLKVEVKDGEIKIKTPGEEDENDEDDVDDENENNEDEDDGDNEDDN